MRKTYFRPFTGILVVLFIGLTGTAVIEQQIFSYMQSELPKTPEVAGANIGIGGVVEPTPENQAWEEIRKKQQELDTKEKALQNKNTSFIELFTPTEKNLKVLYFTLLVLIALICINIYIDLRIWKNRKKLV